jgi:hypothetical protein
MNLFAYIVHIKYATGRRRIHPDIFDSIASANRTARELYYERSKQDKAIVMVEKRGMETYKVPKKKRKSSSHRIVKTKVVRVIGRTVTVK